MLQRGVVYSLTNSALVYEPKCEGRRGVAVFQPMSTDVYCSLNKLWRSNSIFNVCIEYMKRNDQREVGKVRHADISAHVGCWEGFVCQFLTCIQYIDGKYHVGG